VVEPLVKGDELVTDVQKITQILEEKGKEVLCVVTTTSCFAPRAIDLVADVGVVCK
jgi:O-phospho-L-seryl-tRNASec:L-selenocysteinyl-tRNA synthase